MFTVIYPTLKWYSSCTSYTVLTFKIALCVGLCVCGVCVTEYDHSGVLHTVEQICRGYRDVSRLCPPSHQHKKLKQKQFHSISSIVLLYSCYSYMYTLHID
jgi:hypothetical protein